MYTTNTIFPCSKQDGCNVFYSSNVFPKHLTLLVVVHMKCIEWNGCAYLLFEFFKYSYCTLLPSSFSSFVYIIVL